MKPHLISAQEYWTNFVQPGHTLIDATCGNGHDTLFLAKLLKGDGKLIGYDIQKKAIENTRLRLNELSEKERTIITLNHASHETFFEPRADLIVYNLGYLPGFNKDITTKVESTLKSVASALQIAKAISITCYPGHLEGEKEEKALLSFLEFLSSADWSICYHKWLNRPFAPTLIWVKKLL